MNLRTFVLFGMTSNMLLNKLYPNCKSLDSLPAFNQFQFYNELNDAKHNPYPFHFLSNPNFRMNKY